MEWIFPIIIILFLICTDVNSQNCIPEVKGGSTFWVEEGRPFVVNCSLSNCRSRYEGTQWWMNGSRVFGMDFTKRIYETKFLRRSKLVINPVKPKDASTFTCINDVDPTKNVTIRLHIGVPDLTTISSIETTLSASSQSLQSWTLEIPLILITYIICQI